MFKTDLSFLQWASKKKTLKVLAGRKFSSSFSKRILHRRPKTFHQSFDKIKIFFIFFHISFIEVFFTVLLFELFTEIFLKNFLGTGDRRKEGVEDERREEDGVGKGETGGVLKRRNWRSKVLMWFWKIFCLLTPLIVLQKSCSRFIQFIIEGMILFHCIRSIQKKR